VIIMSAGAGQQESIAAGAVHANLASSNLAIRLKITNAQRVHALTLALSGAGGSSSSIELRDSYERFYTGDWMTITLGRESGLGDISPRSGVPEVLGGRWMLRGGFQWKQVRAVRLTMLGQAGPGPTPMVQFGSISQTPQQRSGAVVFVFDDGYESILPAAAAMHSMGMAGDVAVIGKYAELPTFQHLNVYELRMLQNQWGWNMVNHTQQHADAVADYYPRRAYGAYEEDLLAGAKFLHSAGLDSAPNWLIYPHGTTNDQLGRVVSRFYTFARTTDDGPEAFPFGSPLRVKTLELRSPGDNGESGGSTELTPPAEVIQAARDALAYHTTQIFTLHRISAIPDDRGGYPIRQFIQILRGIKALGVPVLTLSGLDRMNGVPESAHVTVTPARPSLTTAAVSVSGSGGSTALPSWPLYATGGLALAVLTLLRAHAIQKERRKRPAPRTPATERDPLGV
jgi:hypothetical protein